MPNKPLLKEGILLLITLIGIIAVFFMDAIPQDLNYHHFADRRQYLSIPHFWNVVSNCPLSIIGSFGMFFILKQRIPYSISFPWNKFIFFIGIFFTGIGSAYYHLDPTNTTLLWDRLPMTIAFMSFFSIIISEFACFHSGRNFLIPLLSLGILSILYWQMTQNRGQADLRFYAIVQFLPLLLIPLIMFLYPSKESSGKVYWFILLAYLMAKVCEAGDHEIYNSVKKISGHTVKHFAAAIGPLIFLIKEYRQKKTPST